MQPTRPDHLIDHHAPFASKGCESMAAAGLHVPRHKTVKGPVGWRKSHPTNWFRLLRKAQPGGNGPEARERFRRARVRAFRWGAISMGRRTWNKQAAGTTRRSRC